jgi:hypothetical protein
VTNALRTPPPVPDLAASQLARDGFAFAPAAATETLLQRYGLADWQGFADSWNGLGLDLYMADGGRYRRRRHAAFAVAADGSIERKPHQPHYQSRDYNTLNGGIERWFEPVTDAIAGHPALTAILKGCHAMFHPLTPAEVRPAAWHCEVHQFRIEARSGQEGRPTPEGMHRDGVDWVLVLLVARRNIASGTTSIHDLARTLQGTFTLSTPMDAAWVDDSRVYHGVTPVEPLDPGQEAYRDVLVVTFRR